MANINHPNALSALYQNVRGLRTKLPEFRLNVQLNKCDIFFITESWLNNSVLDCELVDLNTYDIFRRDRETSGSVKSEGGGVLIAAHGTLQASLVPEFQSESEDVWIRIGAEGHGHIYLCCVYLPPGDDLCLANFVSKLGWITQKVGDNNIIICGDFNRPTLNWIFDENNTSLRAFNIDLKSIDFVDTLSFCGLIQSNYIKNSLGRTLDLVLSNNSDGVKLLSHCTSPMVPEDNHHPALEFLIPARPAKTLQNPNVKFLNFHKANYIEINNKLSSVIWENVLSKNNLNENLVEFYETLNNIISTCVPTGYRKGNFPAYFSATTIKVIKEKNKIHQKWKTYGNLGDFNTFKLLRRRSKKLIQDDYRNYVNYIEEEIPNDCKKFWHFVSAKRRHSNIPSEMMYENTSTSGNQSICNLFAEYFQSVYQPNLNNVGTVPSTGDANIGRIRTCQSEVLSVLRSLDPKKGAGPDGIPAFFVKECAQSLAFPLARLFNQSLDTGTFPNLWKRATIIPIHKCGDKKNIKNYRPICKISTFAKSFEKIIYKHLLHLVRNIILPQQHGFFPGRSIESNLITYSQFILNSMDNRIQVDSVYTDFSKAFDKIDHNILLHKLSAVGVCGPMLEWFKSYVCDREYSVSVAGSFSEPFLSISGVPQGSHLGPLLFIVYINDIGDCFKNTDFLFYADDLKLFKKIHNFNDCYLLQSDLNTFATYCKNNSLFINTDKCFSISFTRNTNRITFEYSIDSIALRRERRAGDLGVLFDEKMIFDQHIDIVVNKALKMLGFVKRQFPQFSRNTTLISLYYAYVFSRLNFASPVWNPQYNIYIDRIERVQNKFLKSLAFKNNVNSDYDNLRRRFRIISLQNRRVLNDIIVLHKILNSKIDSMDLLSSIPVAVPTRNLRHTRSFEIPFSHTNSTINSPLLRMLRSANDHNDDLDLYYMTQNLIKNKLINIFLNT